MPAQSYPIDYENGLININNDIEIYYGLYIDYIEQLNKDNLYNDVIDNFKNGILHVDLLKKITKKINLHNARF